MNRGNRVFICKRIGFGLLVSLALCADSALPGSVQPKRAGAVSSKNFTPLVPPRNPYVIPVAVAGVYTGAYCPLSETRIVTEKSIYDFESMTEKKIVFVQLFVNWTEEDPLGEYIFLPFPGKMCEMISRRGSIPMITWQANLDAKDPEKGFLLDRIANGEFDEYLRSWTDKIKLYPGPVLLRWGHEMNGDWFSWSGVQNGADKSLPGPEAAGPSGPARFRKAYNHIHDLFRIENVKNVHWVWSVYHGNVVGKVWNEDQAYWPGDDRVDWIGIGAINWSRANREGWKKWRSLSDILEGPYKRLTKKFPSKPIFLAELACANQAHPEDGDKVLWIKDAMKSLQKKYPQIKAFCWYNDSLEAQPGYYPANFRLDFSPHRKVYSEGISGSYFLGGVIKRTLPSKKIPVRGSGRIGHRMGYLRRTEFPA